ncbi:FGGY-family carbohydrate kinase [Puia sp. P3]|uniref:FGGY-family carbohydrate kinase n=1 Tax=Puia sp. P3 TaxID=3423952 RepID=UPI003D66F3B8
MNVIAIFDIGKTNKKLFLFDEHYKIVWERSTVCDAVSDEDGDTCEDVLALREWVCQSLAELSALKEFDVRAINFSAYGASFVHIGQDGQPVAPLYNYLKAYPEELKKKFYDSYGGEVTFSMLTASPVLGSLNSGMQLYRIRELQPELFGRIKYSLHLPQWLSYLLTGRAYSDITSIGCHTNLWNFSQANYHEWVYREGIIEKLAPIAPSTSVVPIGAAGSGVTAAGLTASEVTGDAAIPAFPGPPFPTKMPAIPIAGIGLHDSSAAIIPYLESFREPFVLISTGTWCISMNPFNDSPLTVAELQKDCLCYMSYQGKPVKASRLFAGYEHEQQVRRLADHFHKLPAYAATVDFDPELVEGLREMGVGAGDGDAVMVGASVFGQRELTAFISYEQAYHRLIMDIMEQQVASTQLVLEGTEVKRIFVDGGFGKNQVYMHLLADAFPDIEVFAASIPQATAMGAALAIHSHWNSRFLPGDIIELKYYK